MTDKTDIKALMRPVRDRYDWSNAVWRDCDQCGKQHTGTVKAEDDSQICAHCADQLYWSAWQVLAEQALDQLEAERQRADELESSNDRIRQRWVAEVSNNCDAGKRVNELEAELSALRGEQEPVGFTNDKGLEALSKGYMVTITPDDRLLSPVPLFTRQPKPVVVLPEINDDLVEILGRPNFTCAGLAELFRRNGADIKRKSENEQAFVLHWLMGVYLNHHDGWRVVAEAELKAIADKVKAENAAGIVVKDGE